MKESSCSDIYQHCYLQERVLKIKPYQELFAYKFEAGDIRCFDVVTLHMQTLYINRNVVFILWKNMKDGLFND